MLSLPPMVGIGLISYSAYLWHQPVLSIARVASLHPPSQLVMGSLSLMSLGLAWLSWRFVESPFRSAKRVPLRPFVWAAYGGSLVLIVAGLYLHFEQGLPKRTFPNIDQSADVYISFSLFDRHSLTAFLDAATRGVVGFFTLPLQGRVKRARVIAPVI